MDSIRSPSDDVFLVRGAAGDDGDDAAVAVALGDLHADLGHAFVLVRLVGGVFGGGEIAGVGVEGLEQAVQRTGGDVLDVGLGDVVGLDLMQYFLVDAHLAVGAVTLGGADARGAEAAEEHNNNDGNGEDEDGAIETSGHRRP